MGLDYGLAFGECTSFYQKLGEIEASYSDDEMTLDELAPKFKYFLMKSCGFFQHAEQVCVKTLARIIENKGAGSCPIHSVFSEFERLIGKHTTLTDRFKIRKGESVLYLSDLFLLVGYFYQIASSQNFSLKNARPWLDKNGYKNFDDAFMQILTDSLSK